MTATRSPSTSPAPTGTAAFLPSLNRGARQGWALFRAFRRTRPFWGGLWLLVGGWLVLRLSLVSAQVVLVAGISGVGGWLTGGGMILCGLAAWFARSQRYVTGLVGIVLAIASLIVSNLGGLFVGMLFGIIGGCMTLAWGPKRARPPRRRAIGLLDFAPNPANAATVVPAPAPTLGTDRPSPHPRPEHGALRSPHRDRA